MPCDCHLTCCLFSWWKPLSHLFVSLRSFLSTDHPGWYQENIWGILREQRLLLRCLCKVSCVPQQSQALRSVGNPHLPAGENVCFLASWWVIAGGWYKVLYQKPPCDRIGCSYCAWRIVQKAILRWFSCSTVYLHVIRFILWMAATTFH